MTVPVGRRLLLAQPARLVASTAAVGLAFMLILLFDGLWTGVRAQVTAYEDRSGADLFVLAPGAGTLFAEGGAMPRATVDTIRRTEGVAWAAPIRSMFSIVWLHEKRVAFSVVGYQPGDRGGPWEIADGRPIRRDGEAVIDPSTARRHDLDPGDDLRIQDRRFEIVGVAAPPGAFMTGLVFLSHADTDALLGSPGFTTAVLIGADRPAATQARLAAAGLNVADKAALREADTALATRIYGRPLRLMVGSAVVTGILLIGFVGYTAVTERRRQYGLIKALGASRWRVLRLALGQTAVVTLLGLATGAGMLYAAQALLAVVRPQFPVIVEPETFLRTVAIAALMAAVAALLPAERLLRLDPATAFRGS